MNVLLSIKPKYAEAIISGFKKYEFRKNIFKRKEVDRVYMYISSPVKRIVGFFEVEQIIADSPWRIWQICAEESGISKIEFFEYFSGSSKAFAIKIGKVSTFSEPINPYGLIENFRPPQSFCYLPNGLLDH